MTENTSNLRELAQVFSRALSAYLEDPEEFRKVLSEVRPTPPGLETTASTNDIDSVTPSTTTKEYSDHEEDEVLEYSDDSKTHKRPTIQKIYSQQEQEKEKKKSVADSKYSTDRKGKTLVTDSITTTQPEYETTTYATVAFQLSDLADPTRLPFETLENSQSSYYSPPQQQIAPGNQVASEINTEQSGDASLTSYNLPAGTKQFEGPKYGPQPGEKNPSKPEAKVITTRHRFAGFGNDYRSQLLRRTSTVRPTSEDTTIVDPSTTPLTTQGNVEGTTFQYVNQYDGYPIPVLNSDLSPPFEPTGFQNDYSRENDTLLVYFAPEDVNNLAVINASEETPTTYEIPTTEESVIETTTLPPTTTEAPILPEVVTTLPAGQYVRFNAKEERQGRRVSFSRNSEAGESLVRAHSASFSSSRNSKEITNQRVSVGERKTLNRIATVQVNPYSINQELVAPEYVEPSTTTPQPQPSRRPVVRRRFKTTSTEVTDAPVTEEQLPVTDHPFFLQRVQQTHLVLDTSSPSSIGVIEQRYRSTTVRSTTEPVVYTTTQEPIVQTNPPVIVLPQNNARPSVSSSVSYASKNNKPQRRFKSTTSKAVETTTRREPERQETVPPTYLPEPTFVPVTEMPAEKEMSMEAEMMFGKLNESSINHLMGMMKMAESNTTVRRLVLLLVNHGPQNKSTEESRRHLIEALLRTPDEVPAESQHEAISSPLQQVNATTSMKISMTIGTSSKVSNRRGKTIRTSQESSRKSNNLPTTTPPVLATTYRNNARRVVYKPTVPTTTKKSVERKRTASSTTTTTTMKISTSSGNSTIMAKKIYEKLTNDSTGTTGALSDVSDNRAVDLLRSLYSLAARFG